MKLILLFIIILSIPFNVLGGELEDRQGIEQMVSFMLMKEQFSELSKLSNKYLMSEERTSSGLWKLTMFYSGVVRIINRDFKQEYYWDRLENRALKWVESQPQSPSGYIAYALILIERAWMYRGDGWAHEVKKENRKPFYKNIEKAKQYLTTHYEIVSTDPLWYETMLVIAIAEGWNKKSFELLIEEGTSKFPYFYQLYFVAIDYLTPKWHGSKPEIEEFALKAVQITRAKEKTGMYARIYWYASQTNYGEKLFTESAVTWDRMITSIDDVLESYPDQWNINNFAYFSCLAKDKIKTNKLINQIKDKPIIAAWKNIRNFNQCKEWAAE